MTDSAVLTTAVANVTRQAQRSGAGAEAVRWSPAFAVAAALVALLVIAGTSVTDIARYAAYLCWAVLLPGTLVYRSLRRSPHSLVDDLALGGAVGLCLEILAYLGVCTVDRLTGIDLRGALGLWPVAVVLPFGWLPRLRRHWRPRGLRRAPLGWSWAVASAALFLLGYLYVVFLRPNQPVPVTHPQAYFIDQMFSLALVGEATHHFPPHTPWVAGEPLLYHWFAFAHMAVGSLVSGVDPPIILFRLALPTTCVLAVVLLAVVGWRVSGRPWVGAIATGLTFVVGELAVGSLARGPLGGITAFMSWGSTSLVYGTVITTALLLTIVDRWHGLVDAPLGHGGWVLLGLLVFVAPGAKSSILPVALCGVGVVCLVELWRRQIRTVSWIVAAALASGELFALLVWYRADSQGIRVGPLAILSGYVSLTGGRGWWQQAGPYAGALLVYLVFMCARLAGVPVLARLHRGQWSPAYWFLLGCGGGGVAVTLLLRHPSWSQNFFIRSGWPAGAILSAMGLVALIDRYRLSAATIATIVGATTAIASGASLVVAGFSGGVDRLKPHVLASVYLVGGLLGLIGVLLAAGLVVARRANRRVRGLAAVVTLILALDAGLPGLAWDAVVNSNGGQRYHLTVTPGQAAAARWIRDHSRPTDVLATNAHCVRPRPARCVSLSFWLSAFSQRRVLVESWGYTAPAMNAAAAAGRLPGMVPFGDQVLLARNDAAINAPTPARIAWLRRRQVRWIVVDRRFGREPARLGELARLTVDTGDVAVYELVPPPEQHSAG